ncbi:hypothetical protein [Bombilactobacillus bombi]|uniref:hypothetical protein n=1 Tax=Bombilactobacillus bombi TaxID=1303590 RepID=UPI0015E5D122|nr:hypothetical protein [Bombilactobacillus bombi]MBA1434639.1 hypothetical protein [Bombilactobacillus bombi]
MFSIQGLIICVIAIVSQSILSRFRKYPYLGFILPLLYLIFILYLYFVVNKIPHLWQALLVLIGGEAVLLEIQYTDFKESKDKRKRELDKIKAHDFKE